VAEQGAMCSCGGWAGWGGCTQATRVRCLFLYGKYAIRLLDLLFYSAALHGRLSPEACPCSVPSLAGVCGTSGRGVCPSSFKSSGSEAALSRMHSAASAVCTLPQEVRAYLLPPTPTPTLFPSRRAQHSSTCSSMQERAEACGSM